MWTEVEPLGLYLRLSWALSWLLLSERKLRGLGMWGAGNTLTFDLLRTPPNMKDER